MRFRQPLKHSITWEGRVSKKRINWRIVGRKFKNLEITEVELLKRTEDQRQHPEWWNYPCICDLCLSYGD